ncbi:MAG TPA: lysophospholipid acyltransferase family protein [Symbiobacteriaceae bacterium]
MPRETTDAALRRSNLFFRTLRQVGRLLFRLVFSIKVEGLDRLPRGGSYILVCNHLSTFDPLLLLVCLPPDPRIHFLAAAEHTVRGSAFVRWIIRHAGGVIPVDRQTRRGNLMAVAQGMKVLRSGGILGIFPEGKRGKVEGQLQPLKEGAARLAVKTGCPILVTGISGTSELYWRRRICLRIGPLLTPEPGESPEALQARLEAAMAATIPPVLPGQPKRKWMTWLSRLF